jgi:glycosyltransferase involved in cell wall biosynthesis
MKICLYGYDLVTPGGGTTQYTRILGKWLVAQGHVVTVVTRRWANAHVATEGVRYHFLSVDSRPEQAFQRYVQYGVKSILYFSRHSHEYDLVHCMSGFQSFAILPALIKRWTHIPMAYTVLSPFRSRVGLSAFDKLICVSRNIERRLRGPHSVYIPPFIETERFRTSSRYEFAEESDWIVGTMGYPVYRKGNRYLLEAIPFVLERFPRTLFLLAIDLPAVSYRKKLADEKIYIEALIRKYGLEKNARILGKVDVPRFLNSLNLFVYPVQTTAGMIDIPPTLLECLAAGCGVVTSRQGGIEEVIEDGYNGLLVPRGEHSNPRAYADRIIALMDNKSLLERFKLNGPPSVEGFDVRRILPCILEVYQEIVEPHEAE